MQDDQSDYKRFKVLAVNDEKDFCQCCGKKDLKKVVWIEDQIEGDIQHFGTICALHPKKAFGQDREVKAAIHRFENNLKAITMMTHVEYRKAGGKYARVNEFTSRPADPVLFDAKRTEVRAAHPRLS